MLLYIAFYIVASISKKHKKAMEYTLAILLVVWIFTYFIFVDKSIYHIDDVSKPFIWFLYFSSMLMGALFKKYTVKFDKIKMYKVLLFFVSLIVYFGSKIAFSKIQSIVFWQILNQLSILVVLYFLFTIFIGLEKKWECVPKRLNNAVKFLANITLHIYIVQFVLIRRLENLIFPINFLVTTLAILALATVLYYVERCLKRGILLLVDKIKGKGKNAESNN